MRRCPLKSLLRIISDAAADNWVWSAANKPWNSALSHTHTFIYTHTKRRTARQVLPLALSLGGRSTHFSNNNLIILRETRRSRAASLSTLGAWCVYILYRYTWTCSARSFIGVCACAEIVKSSYLKMGLAPNLSQGDWLVAKLDFGGDA
jgi:hypothetical protein